MNILKSANFLCDQDFSDSKRTEEQRERRKELRKEGSRKAAPSYSFLSGQEEAGAVHPLGCPCQSPAAPVGTEYGALHCTIWKDCEADKWGPWNGTGSASVTWFSICHTTLCSTGGDQYKIALKTPVFLLHLRAAKEEV